jgi:ubiquinone/menaquinone biosynthesis C-methylase UbiE
MAEERLDPVTACSASFWEHAYRYRFAAGYVRNKRVLDVACGEGYGTAALERAGSKTVLGVDVSPSVCSRAGKKYGGLFCAGDAHAMPLADESIDVIVTFETIEHLRQPETFLDECVRVLAPKGLLIASTPNKAVHDETPESNPFHCSEMKEEDFLRLLGSRFKYTKRFAQIIKDAPWWSPLSVAATHAQWIRFRGGWRAREWLRALFCPHIGRDLDGSDRGSPVEAILSGNRFLERWVNPYCVRPRTRNERERPWYLVTLSHD